MAAAVLCGHQLWPWPGTFSDPRFSGVVMKPTSDIMVRSAASTIGIVTTLPGNTGRWLYGTTGGSRIAKARVNTSGKACTQLHDGYSADEEGKCDGDARLAVSIDMVLSTATVVDQPN